MTKFTYYSVYNEGSYVYVWTVEPMGGLVRSHTGTASSMGEMRRAVRRFLRAHNRLIDVVEKGGVGVEV